MAFKTILDRSEREGLSLNPIAVDFMQAMIIDIEARLGTDKSADRFRYMDDKWLFTRTYFDGAAEKAGFRSVKVIARTVSETSFRYYVTDMFQCGRQIGPDALPDWAWESIDLLDRSLSPEMNQIS